jgi:Ca2+-transporting ATPase
MTGLQAAVNLVPGLRRMLGTAPLGPGDLLVIAAGTLLPLVVNEATKPPAPAPSAPDAEAEATGEAGVQEYEEQEERA